MARNGIGRDLVILTVTNSPIFSLIHNLIQSLIQNVMSNMNYYLSAFENLISSRIFKKPRIYPPNPTGLNTLHGLLPELLLLISDFLSFDDILCLSLCTRRLFAVFERQKRDIQQRRSRNILFLRRLKRDLPNHYICCCCVLIHEHDGMEVLVLPEHVSSWDHYPARLFVHIFESGPWYVCCRRATMESFPFFA